MKTLRLLLVCFFACIAGYSYAFDIPQLQGYRVNDHANLLTQEQRTQLENSLRALEEKTTAQVAILTVSDLQGQDIKSFAVAVASSWKLGQRGKDNGLLILYTMKEDRYRLEVGYGLEGIIPDGVAGRIIREKLRAKADPKRGTRDFYAAFAGAVEEIEQRILADAAKPQEQQAVSSPPPAVVIIGGIALIVIVGLIVLFVMASNSSEEEEPKPTRGKPPAKLRSRPSRHAHPRHERDHVLVGTSRSHHDDDDDSSSGWSSGSSDSGGVGDFSGGGGTFGGGGADG